MREFVQKIPTRPTNLFNLDDFSSYSSSNCKRCTVFVLPFDKNFYMLEIWY